MRSEDNMKHEKKLLLCERNYPIWEFSVIHVRMLKKRLHDKMCFIRQTPTNTLERNCALCQIVFQFPFCKRQHVFYILCALHCANLQDSIHA